MQASRITPLTAPLTLTLTLRAQPLTLAATLSLTLQGESGSVKAKLSAKDRAFKQQLRQASDEMDELRAELASANAQVAT